MTGLDVEMQSHQEVVTAMKSLENIVDPKGGINSPKHITPLIKWMSDAQGFDVRIVYVCVVNATESRDILSEFIQQGGWNCLAKWLEYFITSNKHAAIRELLLCFQKLPIEAKTLSVPVDSKVLPGKMIRRLQKHHDSEIKTIATTIFEHWNNLVKEKEERKAAKKREKQAAAEAVKAKKAKSSGPTLTDNFLDGAFLSEEQKKKAAEDKKRQKQKKKEEKKKKEEAKKQPLAQFNGHLSILNELGQAPPPKEVESVEESPHSKFENLGNRSPPMHLHGEATAGIKGSPPHKNDLLPRKEPKPGAKAVRWADTTGARPLEQVREFEIIPNERVNVNNREYKIMMETEAFKEDNSGPLGAASLGDLMPKRQWRSPKRSNIYLGEQVKKNVEAYSKDSKEKQAAAEKTARTLQQIYLKAQIPFSPSEPDNQGPTGPVGDIPRIPLEMAQDKNAAPAATTTPTPTPAMPDIDFGMLNRIVNSNSLNQSSNSASRSPSAGRGPGTPSPARNAYDYPPPRDSYSHQGHPPQYRGSTPPVINDQRDYRDGYRRDNYSGGGARYGSYPDSRPRYNERPRDPSPSYRRSRSPPYRGHERDHPYRREPPRQEYRGGYRR